MTHKETPDGTPYGGDPQATPTGPQVPPTPPTTREEIPKFYAGGKALSKSEVVVTYKDHLAAMASATKEREEAVREARLTAARMMGELFTCPAGQLGKQILSYRDRLEATPPEKTTDEVVTESRVLGEPHPMTHSTREGGLPDTK